MKYVLGVAIAATALIVGMDSNYAGEKKEPKYTIKEVMKKAHAGKGAIMKAVAAGKASDEEKQELVELYTALAMNKPPMGDEGEWKEQTGKMLQAAKKAAKGDEKAAASLTKIVNCGACHKKFK
jgi:hypothetical protein